MNYRKVSNRFYVYLIIAIAIGTALFIAIKDIFFFDEDIFVANSGSDFVANVWDRLAVVKFLYRINNFSWQTNPFGYHLMGLLLHLFNAMLALLVFKILLKLTTACFNLNYLNILPFIFFILFLLSPIHSEPLCYILASCSSVCSMFCLLSILFFLKAQQKNKALLFFSLLSFLFALFSYEISWTLPFIILSIATFIAYIKKEPLKRHVKFALPYFVVFAAWFIIKVAIIDKFVVTDYKDDQFFKISLLTIAKNNAVLFLRNFIPPFKSTAIFLSVGLSFIAAISLAFVKLFRTNRQLFYFLLLLLGLTFLGFAAACLIGIDSHDSESERYIYFSSAFAIMFLSVLLTNILKNKSILFVVIFALGIYYSCTLFKTLGYYKKASDFSQMYLKELNKRVHNKETVLFINQPSQYEGALLFRAKSRIDSNTNDKVNILQEYFSYLYNKKENCFTSSSKELLNVPAKLVIVEKSVDSLTNFFPEAKTNQSSLISSGKNITYVALQDSTLFFFK